jgi:hypothetical protein
MAEGYLGPEYPRDYVRDPFFSSLVTRRVDRRSAAALRDFIVRRRITSVIVESGNPRPWSGVLASLRLRPVSVGGVLLYRVPRAWLTS